MKLIDGWKAKFPKLWSVRLAILSAILGVAELTLPLFQTFIPPMTFAVLSVVASLAAAVARIVAQPSLHE
jgi:uncharacterized membrane protein HdeD (DUF308 family)